jgi:triosephosphate isomerase
MTRRQIMAGNWKMHKTHEEAAEFGCGIIPLVQEYTNLEIVVCPPFTSLASLASVLSGSNVSCGGQNLYWEDKGAYTGETSPVMLSALGCQYVILGHSERRKYFYETYDLVKRKIIAASAHGLVPIVCVGEYLDEREAGRTEEVLSRQVEEAFSGLTSEMISSLAVAYEPIWAIGTGKNASADDAQTGCALVRSRLKEIAGDSAAAAVRILYGGSVKPANVKDYVSCPDMDGGLVGGASLEPQLFAELVEVWSTKT